MTAATRPKVVIKPRLTRWSRLRDHRVLRRLTLVVTSVLVVWTAGMHALVGAGAASAEALCPFGGLETLYRYATSGGSLVPHTHLANLVLFGAVILLAILLRSAFCGWLCPLGFFQEVISAGSRAVQRRVPPVRRAVRGLQRRGAFLGVIDRPLRLLKYAVLVWAVGGAAAFGVMVFRDWDPWNALLEIGSLSLGPGLAVLAAMMIASLFVERPWCRYACPLGAVSGLAAIASPMRLQRDANLCKACGICDRACPMGLPVATSTVIASVDCIGCLECVGVCPREGALEVRMGIPILGAHLANAAQRGAAGRPVVAGSRVAAARTLGVGR